jgi:hypothetical protein
VVFEAINEHVPHHPPMLGGAGVLLVPRDVPDVPLTRQGEGLALRQRSPLATLCCADRRDLALDLRGELADAHLGILRACSGRQGQLGLPPLSVQPLVLGAYVLGDAFADRDRA